MKSRELRKKLKWLIEQINKQINYSELTIIMARKQKIKIWWEGYTEALIDVRRIIKEAFKEVLEK